MNNGIRIHHHPHPFTTESGHVFPELDIAYKTWGTLNEAADNAVLVCHALTGHAAADEWFPGLFDADGILDPSRQFIVCSNVLGSCYGTTGPRTGRARGGDFPIVTIRDMVRVEQILIDALGVKSIELAIGGSMGGMQVLEWSVMDHRVQKMMLIAMGKAHSAWAIGIGEAQRQAIYADPNWNGGHYPADAPPAAGLSSARQMGMVFYRSAESFERRFGRDAQPGNPDLFKVQSYLQYQGAKLVDRFDAVTYVRLTQAMDSHDIARGRGTFEDVLGAVTIPALVLGISSDALYWPWEQKELARLLGNGTYSELDSDEGHDAFLIEFPKMVAAFRRFEQFIYSQK